jgi:hypothetical protein
MGRLRIEASLIKYIEYSTGYAIRSTQPHPSWTNQDGWTNDTMNNADPNPINIPAYQRKLVWQSDDIEGLFITAGKLLGNITFANVEIPDSSNKTELTLVDGLQRFSAITSIMRSLYNNVLATHAAFPNLADSHFQKIRDNLNPSHAIIWEHNHSMLLHNTRDGIKSSYEELSRVVDDYIVEQLKKIEKDPTRLEFAGQVHKTLFDKMVVTDVYLDFDNPDEIIETFKDVNSTGVSLSNTDILRAKIILKTEQLHWGFEEVTEGENRFTRTLQPEKNSPVNKEYRKWFGLRLFQAHKTRATNVFPDWDNLSLKSLETLFDYIEDCETAQRVRINNTQYRYPYLEEIFNCGALPFIAFIWFYYQNHYLPHLEEIQSISNRIKEEFTLASMNEGESSAQTTEQIEKHVNDTLEKLTKIDATLHDIEEKLNITDISDSRKKRLEDEKDELTQLQQTYPDYYRDLPDFLGGSLDTTQDALLFLRAAYRRQMNGDIGSTAPIVDRLMNRDITTIAHLAEEFNPEEDAGPLNQGPNEEWLRGRLLAKGGTSQAKYYFNACLLPIRNSGNTEFNILVYGNRVGQWNIDHLIPNSRIVAGDGNIEGKKIVNFAPLDNAHNIMAKTTRCAEKISTTGYYSQIMGSHPYCTWLVEEHYVDHQYDDRDNGTATGQVIPGGHPLDKQASLVHNHPSNIGDERIEKIISLLTPKL